MSFLAYGDAELNRVDPVFGGGMECMKARPKGCSSGGNTTRASSRAEGLRVPQTAIQ